MNAPKTIQDLIDEGFPLDKPLVLIDPDTYWPMWPKFLTDDEAINIMGDYGDVIVHQPKNTI